MSNIKEEILKLIPEEIRGQIVGDELFFLCPNPDHHDTNPTNCSINLKTGKFYCFACGFKGNLKKLRKLLASQTTNYYINDPFKRSSSTKKQKKKELRWL